MKNIFVNIYLLGLVFYLFICFFVCVIIFVIVVGSFSCYLGVDGKGDFVMGWY